MQRLHCKLCTELHTYDFTQYYSSASTYSLILLYIPVIKNSNNSKKNVNNTKNSNNNKMKYIRARDSIQRLYDNAVCDSGRMRLGTVWYVITSLRHTNLVIARILTAKHLIIVEAVLK